MSEKQMTIAFIGNPNCGKTTLFNAYTGANLKVANWPGVTVEKVEGAIRKHGLTIHLVDLPGTYALNAYTMEEKVSRDFILSDEVDVIVDVIDASCLQRNLYLALQLIELDRPLVLAFNMMDIVNKRGMEIDFHRLSDILGVPCIPVSARKKSGLDILLHNCIHHADGLTTQRNQHEAFDRCLPYTQSFQQWLKPLEKQANEKYPDQDGYWIALKTLENDTVVQSMYPLEHDLDLVEVAQSVLNAKFAWIEELCDEVVMNKNRNEQLTESIDHWLTHPKLGVPIFLVIMAIVFMMTFTIGDWIKGYFELGLEWISGNASVLLTSLHTSPWLISLLVDGIINGVGTILTFLPNIVILFIALALLEDSGYMARVAYVMEGIMSKFGVSGRAFIPMILGFGCTVPAIMASRTLESVSDRRRVMLITPFMSCSARLPIYILFSSMFFGSYAMIVAYLMYVIGLGVAILVAAIMHRLKPSAKENALLIELPDYKLPSAFTVFVYVWEKVKDYLTKAGTTIFVASIIMWGLLNLGPNGFVTNMTDSFGATIGHGLAVVLAPVGLGFWQIAVALLAGISAKEVVVSSTAVLFGIGNINSADGMVTMAATLSSIGLTTLNAFALMVFCLLYTPCVATLATIKRESDTKFMIQCALFQLGVAWLVTFVVYQIGNLLF